MELSLGRETLEAAIFRSSYCHEDTGTGKHQFRVLTQAGQHENPTTPSPTQTQPWHQYRDASGHAAIWVRPQLHLPPGHLLQDTPESPAALRPSPAHQRGQDPALLTSSLAPAQGSLSLIARAKISGPSFIPKWAGTSLWIPQATAPPTSGLISALRYLLSIATDSRIQHHLPLGWQQPQEMASPISETVLVL